MEREETMLVGYLGEGGIGFDQHTDLVEIIRFELIKECMGGRPVHGAQRLAGCSLNSNPIINWQSVLLFEPAYGGDSWATRNSVESR